MRRITSLAVLAALGATVAAPSLAQSRDDQARWDAAQTRYQQEFQRYLSERDAYVEARSNWRARSYGGPAYPQGDDRYEGGYDPSQYYRNSPNYRERVLAQDDRVYAGNDGRYYCRRSDGTTGLIVGGAAGGVLGNVIDGGRSRTVGTLLGAAAGALAGKAVDRNQQQIRCR
ncbi:glycine zipper 2TM domain-containing protein [uncultured Sphingomonas sp.]|uniref:glycine zipper 2TM domain-containing protein n=1 Tax=uncultured Sphingomonas sp. TaxID=158754 RepID=UPI0025FAD5AA|nr:glycine zipper 2TM domain-containing protein [uncultured Sphingomonas sp.]